MASLSRRELLRLSAAAGAFLAGDGMMRETQDLVPAVKAADHLLLGVADLDAGIDWVEKRTGVRAAIGGSHPGAGTRNAVLSLGGRQYLEIYAPDPAQAARPIQAELRKLVEPRLIAWAAVTTDIEALAKRARDAGQRVQGPRDGARARPDGTTLRWRTLAIETTLSQEIVDPIPFFIEWGRDSQHPSQDSPKGCELQSFDVETPDPAGVSGILKAIGIDASVTQGRITSLRATLNTPGGHVVLS